MSDTDTQVTPTPAEEPSKEPPKTNGTKDLMRLSIEAHCWGIRSGVSVGEAQERQVVTLKADPSRLSISNKKLTKCPEYTAIRSLDSSFRASLQQMSLRGRRRSSSYTIPVGLVSRVYERMDEYTQERKELIGKFIDEAYDKAVAEAKAKDPLFREDNFPPKEEVRAAFWFEYDWEVEDVPEMMKKLSASAYEREKKRVAERLNGVKQESIAAMREAFSEIMGTLLEKFQTPEEGKKKVLQTGTVNKILDFCDTFDQLNLANDGDLASLVKQFRDATDGKDLSKMKNDPDLRKQAEPALRALKAKADELVQNAPSRRVSWDE